MDSQKKIKLNLIIGIASQLVTIVLGIVVPRLVLTSYGSEINGLLTSVTQIYSYVALLEAGIGTATVQALYKTVGNKNYSATNAVLAATNKYYHRTGVLYLLTIILFSIIYPMVVDTNIPIVTIILVIVLNGLGSVINYFFQGKYFLLLQAEGKNYIQTSLNAFTNIFKNIAKIVLMSLGFDVVFVQAIAMVISLIQMGYITWYIRRYYPWLDLSTKPDFESISQSKNVLVHQISGLIYNNTDTLTLTVFSGLKTVSIYSMYTLLFGMISTALSIVSTSVIFTMGQTFHTNKEKFIKIYDCYELYYTTLVFSLYSVANFFVLPFMKIYTSGVNDVNYIDNALPLLFISTYLLSCGRSASSQAINFAGHFRQTQNRAIAEAVINLTVSLIAVQLIGIYGVLLGTIVALLYRSNDMIIYANHKILNRSVWKAYKRWGVNILVFVFMLAINRFVRVEMSNYTSILLICVPYTLSTLAIFFGVSSLTEIETAKYAFSIVKEKIAKKV